jgi:Zn-dependent peptidase ImmA (M78 family)/O-acetyl-ADP-ribose deacetylase (regulator of RNase III)
VRVKTGITWTNKSALALAPDADPVVTIREAARSLVLKARENGWEGPPFNPLKIVEMLGASMSANANLADARLLDSPSGPIVEYNPQQARERVRFSIAHEVAHMLFPDWADEVRNRGGSPSSDDWQLEMLCNIAASEFVLPIGSIPQGIATATIEDLMRERRNFDVSAEAFLIRFANVTDTPVSVFFASPFQEHAKERAYRIDYSVASPLAPRIAAQGMIIPRISVAYSCTAIGHTDRATESWFTGSACVIEYVGISGYPGAQYPRVAGVVRHASVDGGKTPIRYVHGDVTKPLGRGPRIVCQLVNDRAIRWGGGVAKRFARQNPKAEDEFSEKMIALPARDRLGKVVTVPIDDEICLASVVAQEGYGPSLFPRIRYRSLQEGLAQIAMVAVDKGASVHMPRIGAGAAGGEWSVIEEMIEDELVRGGVPVTVYDLPPRRQQLDLFAG